MQWAIDVELEAIDWLRWEGEKLAQGAVDIDSSLTSRLCQLILHARVVNEENLNALNADALKVFKSAFLAIPYWLKNRKDSIDDFIFGAHELLNRIEYHSRQAREVARLAKKRRREAKMKGSHTDGRHDHDQKEERDPSTSDDKKPRCTESTCCTDRTQTALRTEDGKDTVL